ncbi:amino acid adenylation domain-containing protein [Hypoxylon crocopeplum]|nr:amino acid adenylation domain-containing protein [Hypoxylon crocopeplum]
MPGKEPVALIGSACRFPGQVHTPSQLWDLSCSPRDLLTKIHPDRFNAESYYHPDGQYHGHSNAKHAYLLAGDGICRKFDARFFDISPADANVTDPQIRFALEIVYEALESAGLTIESLRGSNTAVYAGQMTDDYERIMLLDADSIGTYHVTGTQRSMIPSRISHFFDWHGPSLSVDTACSSSLVAVHQAVQQLRSGQSRVAVIVAANLILDPQYFITFSKLHMLSPQGRCRMWDISADGYGRGEGVAALVLKAVTSAEVDSDHIECVIRETGIGQDGWTPGLTTPSPSAQASLIRDCYARAGLDLTRAEDRPQYFEAHGTGTQAGDPVEAEAISSVFFPSQHQPSPMTPYALYVGSIKTVIGHSESASGLAAILRASAALKHALIPPNFMFNCLNPKVEPFCAHLRVPIRLEAWPTKSSVRRASVNNFGFGGVNTHVILESHQEVNEPAETSEQDEPIYTPFVFSAASESALVRYLAAFQDWLSTSEHNSSVHDLVSTLQYRRTRFRYPAAIAASNFSELRSCIKNWLEQNQSKEAGAIVMKTFPVDLNNQKPLILGVFTGQGAQWARQGWDHVASSVVAREIIRGLELRLSQLPEPDRPSWSLLAELERDESVSRIHEATLSQPLCTAVQILQVDLLRAANVRLSAVVGHSSGEIAAAYAGGRISAGDAICIAYYRGLYSHLARSGSGESGTMIAVGTTLEDAQSICESPEFEGRACVAACNSPMSVTLSGDRDAIEELHDIFLDENKTCRILKVDKAYHSHHMMPCKEPYLEALMSLSIKVSPAGRCMWFSSVTDELTNEQQGLEGEYWVRNLTERVMFMQALRSAFSVQGQFDLAMEIGPHITLKGPILETIEDMLDSNLPYTSMLIRGKSSIVSVANALGYVWTHLGSNSVDFQGLETFLTGRRKDYKLMKGLPKYSWDHDREYWHESRVANVERRRPGPLNPLLGHATPTSTSQEVQWRQFLSPSEISWLKGHKLQGQIVFPAAAYVVLAVEAALAICKGEPVALVEVLHLKIGKALTFDHEESKTEGIFSLTDISKDGDDIVDAKFTYNAADDRSDASLDLRASGRLRITLGEESASALPPRASRAANFWTITPSDFYDSLGELGYQYHPPFTGLSDLKRSLGRSTGTISCQASSGGLLAHPAIIDAAFQSVFLAQAAPLDGGIWTLHVPRGIRSVRINPGLCLLNLSRQASLRFDAVMVEDEQDFVGNVDVYPDGQDHAMIQIDGLECSPLVTATASDDKNIFSSVIWDVAIPNWSLLGIDVSATPEQWEAALLLERLAVFCLRRLDSQFPSDHRSRSHGDYVSLFKYSSHVLRLARGGELPFWRPEWEHDTFEHVIRACEPLAYLVDVKLLREIGLGLPDIVNGKKPIEIGMTDNMLGRYYNESIGLSTHTKLMAKLVRQISHRYPNMAILEMGAGTGSATRQILREIGSAYNSYTFTDISSGFFSAAQEELGDDGGFIYKLLDVTRSPGSQGFAEHSYDLIVASMVLHTTPCLEQTLRHARYLLKPGGYLVALEGQCQVNPRFGALFGAFPDWWAGSQDGRELTPFVDLSEWDRLLKATGFSGCDVTSPSMGSFVTPVDVFMSQAIDDRITFLRSPVPSALALHELPGQHLISELIIIGGALRQSISLVDELRSFLGQYCGNVTIARSWKDVSLHDMSLETTVLSLMDLDEPYLHNISDMEWTSFRDALQDISSLLWVTQSRLSSNPHSNMVLGLLRSALWEIPALDAQFLDFKDPALLTACAISEALVRFQATKIWTRRDTRGDILLSLEPELLVDSAGRQLIPRLVPNQRMNNRYNSSKRQIDTQVSVGRSLVKLSSTNSGYVFFEQLGEPRPPQPRHLQCSHSVLSAVRIANRGYMALALGREYDTDECRVSLSTDHTSILSPYETLSVATNVKAGSEARLLHYITQQLVTTAIIKSLEEGEVVFILEPTLSLAAALTGKAKDVGVEVVCATINANPPPSSWINIHPAATTRALAGIIPKTASVFVNCTRRKNTQLIVDQIRFQLSAFCRYEDMNTLFNNNSWTPGRPQLGGIKQRFEAAVRCAESFLAETDKMGVFDVPLKAAEALPHAKGPLAPETIIDWTSSSILPVRVEPIESLISLSPSNTYWLAGLTRSLGLSLCEWMIRRGAKYIVLSSRQPTIEDSWLYDIAKLGVTVKVFRCDLTDKEHVKQVYQEIISTLPPISGVVQGAMILKDSPIHELSRETLQRVSRPKVEGSLHLEGLFQNSPLDFFVFCSSIGAVTGNAGQSNYSAANLFMVGLAEQRRRRGLAASVMHIGPILGVGYIAHQGIDLRRQIKSGSHMFISEQDFHKLFAEAIMAGRPNSSEPVEVATSVTVVDPQDEGKPIWAGHPIMSHYVQQRRTGKMAEDRAKGNASLNTLLAMASTKDDVVSIINDALMLKLCALYQLDPEELSRADFKNLRWSELGTDSLLAVEIRSWFMKTLQVNIPVLKILGGGTIWEILVIAADTIPALFIPNVSCLGEEYCVIAQKGGPKNKLDQIASPYFNPGDIQLGRRDDDVRCPSPVEISEGDTSSNTDLSSVGTSVTIIKKQQLSPSQMMFWLAWNLLEDNTSLNHTACFKLVGRIQNEELSIALRLTAQQHESLRLRFFEEDGRPMQTIIDSPAIHCEFRTVQNEAQATQVLDEIKGHFYDIRRGETMRFAVLSISETVSFMVIGTHSLIMDGTSLQVFLRDLEQHYTSREVGGTEPPFQFTDYIAQQEALLACGPRDEDLRHWKSLFNTLSPTLPVLRLSSACSRPVLSTYENERVELRIESGSKKAVQDLCRRAAVTPFHFYLATFRALLARYADVEDVTIGIGDANRNTDPTMTAIGVFVNLLPLRFRTTTVDIFEQVLKETRDTTHTALEHSQIPFQLLLDELDVHRSPTHTPMFQCFVDYRLGQRTKTTWGGCQMELVAFEASKLAYDITLDIIDDPDGDCRIMLMMRKDMYNRRDAECVAQSYKRLVDQFCRKPTMALSDPEIFDRVDIEYALSFSRGPTVVSKWPNTVIHRIESMVEKHPNDIAVTCLDNPAATATYGDLARRENAITHALLAAGVRPGDQVAVLQEPTTNSVASILAIMRVAAVYVPLDMGNPWSRLAVIAESSQATVLLLDEHTLEHTHQLGTSGWVTINVSAIDSIASCLSEAPILASSGHDAALLYTSGSSGTPKGIVLKHIGLRNWFESCVNVYHLGSERVLQQSSSGFDMSLIQIFTALCFGGNLFLVPRRLRGDAVAISELLCSGGITYTVCCTSELLTWLQHGNIDRLRGSAWRRALTGGEPGVDAVLRELDSMAKDDLRLYHAYGPTETSFTATSMELPHGRQQGSISRPENIPVGHPLPNYSLYVLDEKMRPVPVGIQGEIYIGGLGVASGYLSKPDLTAERFVPNIFATVGELARGWDTLHRTGDLGRWTSGGTLLIEGRVAGDTQVKVRGLRIEMREVEAAILKAAVGSLSQAVVSLRQESPQGPLSLVAHVVFLSGYSPDQCTQMTETLPSRLDLPYYMIPATIIHVDALPMTNSQKVDRIAISKLPLPQRRELRPVGLTGTAAELVDLWNEVIPAHAVNINNSTISLNTDFFYIGGTSLLLLNLRARIQARFGVELRLADLFSNSTVQGMAGRIEQQNGDELPVAQPIGWETETDPSTILVSMLNSHGPGVRVPPAVVVLTGATGYLGRGLLDALIKEAHVEKIHCVGIRNLPGRHDILGSEKVMLHEGDLTRPRIGLSEHTARDIFASADLVIHNGADVSYLKSYHTLRLPNLRSTRDLATLCLPRRIPFHYISSGGACIFAAAAGHGSIGPQSVAAYSPPAQRAPGYFSSKWASEVFLERLAVACRPGWSVWIHRPSNIARVDSPQLDLVSNLRHYCRLMRAVPQTRGRISGALDSVSLSDVVRGVMGAALDVAAVAKKKDDDVNSEEEEGAVEKGARSLGNVRFAHHLGGDLLRLDDLRAWATEGEEDVEILDLREWAARAEARGMHPAVAAVLASFAAEDEIVFPRLMR